MPKNKEYCLIPENYKIIDVFEQKKIEENNGLNSPSISFNHYFNEKETPKMFYISSINKNVIFKIKNAAKLLFKISQEPICTIENDEIVKISMNFDANGKEIISTSSPNTVIRHTYVYYVYENIKITVTE